MKAISSSWVIILDNLNQTYAVTPLIGWDKRIGFNHSKRSMQLSSWIIETTSHSSLSIRGLQLCVPSEKISASYCVELRVKFYPLRWAESARCWRTKQIIGGNIVACVDLFFRIADLLKNTMEDGDLSLQTMFRQISFKSSWRKLYKIFIQAKISDFIESNVVNSQKDCEIQEEEKTKAEKKM